jgi:TetR/AcrR family transcriptional repressor of nem operon
MHHRSHGCAAFQKFACRMAARFTRRASDQNFLGIHVEFLSMSVKMLNDIQNDMVFLDVKRNLKYLEKPFMRRSRAEAAESRARIVKAAASKFREQGIVATGLADFMKAAGMTHGGFYKHFDSKDQLVAEAVAGAACEILDLLSSQASLDDALAGYLSTSFRDQAGQGCPLSALGSELARSDIQTRIAASAAFEKFVKIVAEKLPSELDAEERRQRALLTVTAMIGAMTMARVVNDPDSSLEILRAVQNRLKVSDAR